MSASAMSALEETDVTVPSHSHGPQCGHLAIAHVDVSGSVHVGFVADNGAMQCYAPQTTNPDMPRGSIFNVCLNSTEGNLSLHKRKRQCGDSENCASSANTSYLLLPIEKSCQSLVMDEARFAGDSHTSSTHLHGNSNPHNSHPFARLIRHMDHDDQIIEGTDGNLEMHCKSLDNNVCRVNAILARCTSLALDRGSVPGIDFEGYTALSTNTAKWTDLLVIPDQVSTSVLRVSKGLCCRKEVAKIESILSANVATASGLSQYKMLIDPKAKTITFWHGVELESVLAWLKIACMILSGAGFMTEIITVGGHIVITTEFAISSQSLDPTVLPTLVLPGLVGISVNESERKLTARHFLDSTHAVVRGIMDDARLATNDVLTVDGKTVASRMVLVVKGLCCKKEIPKVDSTLRPLCEEDVLLSFRVVPKEKLVLLYFDSCLEGVDLKVKETLENHGFLCKLPSSRDLTLEAAAVLTTHSDTANKPKDNIESETTEVAPESTTLHETFHPTKIATSTSNLVKCTLSVGGVCCQAEVPSVIEICRGVNGVSIVHVSVVTKQVYIQHDPIAYPDVADRVAKALTSQSFPSQVLDRGGLKQTSNVPDTTSNDERSKLFAIGVRWNVLLATVLWLLSFLSYVRPPESMQYIKYLSVFAVALGLPHIALKGFKSLRRRHVVDINILMSVAVIGALALQDFHEAAAVTVIFSWSDWLEARASRRAKTALLALMDLKSVTAWTESGQEILADEVEVGQKLVVRTGDKIPVDGELISSGCEVDESNLTGESRPVAKAEGDSLSAGTLNVSPFFVLMVATRKSEDSAVSRMIRLVQEASLARSPTEQMVETVAKYYTPIIVVVALAMMSIPWSQGTSVGSFWLHTGLTLLVVACPCALIISTPITYVCALAQAARFGVVVKGGQILESLANVDVVACDKTGTLTRGEFGVDAVYVHSDCGDAELAKWFALVANVERHATHPIAKSLRRYCDDKVSKVDSEQVIAGELDEVLLLESIPGQGVKATLASGLVVYVVGESKRLELSQDSNSQIRAADDFFNFHSAQGRTVCWLLVENRGLILGFATSDQVRDTARQAVKEMTARLGKTVVVLTGDSAGPAAALHELVPELSSVFSALKPDDKVAKIAVLKEGGKRRVMMVGDGVNDAPALSAADVGLAMGVGGAPLALETADCALMDSDLRKVPRLIRLARRTKRKIVENIAFALITKAVMLGLTVAGYVSLGIAIGVDVGSMLIVTLNGVSLLEMKVAAKGIADETSKVHNEHGHAPTQSYFKWFPFLHSGGRHPAEHGHSHHGQSHPHHDESAVV